MQKCDNGWLQWHRSVLKVPRIASRINYKANIQSAFLHRKCKFVLFVVASRAVTSMIAENLVQKRAYDIPLKIKYKLETNCFQLRDKVEENEKASCFFTNLLASISVIGHN